LRYQQHIFFTPWGLFRAVASISCGIYGYPISEACQIVMSEISNFLAQSNTLKEWLFLALMILPNKLCEKQFEKDN